MEGEEEEEEEWQGEEEEERRGRPDNDVTFKSLLIPVTVRVGSLNPSQAEFPLILILSPPAHDATGTNILYSLNVNEWKNRVVDAIF